MSKGSLRRLEKETRSTPVFLPGGFHGQWNLVGYSPQSCKESDTVIKQQNFIEKFTFEEKLIGDEDIQPVQRYFLSID